MSVTQQRLTKHKPELQSGPKLLLVPGLEFALPNFNSTGKGVI